jgi:putative membrane protein
MLMKIFNPNFLAFIVEFAKLQDALVTTLIFVFIGLVFFTVAFFILSKIFNVHKEIEEDQNTALGIVIGSIMIGIALIIGAAIQG